MPEVTVYVVKPGSRRYYQLRWRDPVTGRWQSRSAGTTRRREAEAKARELESLLSAGHRGPVPWDAAREQFEREHLPTLRPRTRESYCVTLDLVERVLGPTRLESLDTAAVVRLREALEGRGVRAATVARHLRHLRAFIRWCATRGLIRRVPRFEMPRIPGRRLMRGRAITAEEFERMLAAIEVVRPRDAALWRELLTGLWLSGLRLGEALALSWNAEAPVQVLVEADGTVLLRFVAEGHKANRDELVPALPDFARWLLENWPPARRHGRVFRVPAGRARVTQVIAAIGRASGVVTDPARGTTVTAHDLRRSCLSRWARVLSPAVLARVARHRSTATTMQYYVDLDARELARELRNMTGLCVTSCVTAPEKPPASGGV